MTSVIFPKNYTMPESVIVVQAHSNRSENKTVHNSQSNETVIIPKVVFFENIRALFTLIYSLVKSEIHERKSEFFLVRKFKKDFKTGLKVIPLK